LESSGYNIVAVGNIGKPILDYNFQRNTIVVIEMSSFQLEYSKYLRPNYAILLNISKDHLDWHGTMKNYINAKFKIFSYQNTNDFAYVFDNQKLLILQKKKI
jgi:UDP-N-acetylmuramoylalanine--D-glutamate ligase